MTYLVRTGGSTENIRKALGASTIDLGLLGVAVLYVRGRILVAYRHRLQLAVSGPSASGSFRPIADIVARPPSGFSQSKVQCRNPPVQIRDVLGVCRVKLSRSGFVEVGRFTSLDAFKELDDSISLLAPILAHCNLDSKR